MRRAAIVCFSILVVLAGCGKTGYTSSPVAAGSSPSQVRSPSPSPGTSTSPVPTSATELACRLPVVAQISGGVERGWITFPGGQYARDTATIANPSSEHMPSYGWGVAAWVPVEQQNVSPDGSDYVVQIDSRSKLPTGFYLVDAKTGVQRLIQSAAGPGGGIYWTILGYQIEGIFLGGLAAAGDVPTEAPGLWLLDPLTGNVRLLDPTHKWDVIGAGAAWAVDAPPNAVGTWTVYRLDLTSGQVNKSYASDDFGGIVAPTPDGEVLVRGGDNGGPERIFLLTRTGQLIPVALSRE